MTTTPSPARRVLVPADYFTPAKADETFADQAAALAEAGWAVSTVSDDPTPRLRPAPQPGETVMYRGWMLDSVAYRALEAAVAGTGAQLVTPHAAYLTAHHLPNWYPLLVDLTPETVFFPADADLARELAALSWDGYFIKDHVKSLKTAGGSVITRPEDVTGLVERMAQFRGTIEGGLCVRRLEDLDPATETRYFVHDGAPYGPDGDPVPDIVRDAAARIPSPFFSVDVIRRADGALRIVEIGDGQVSDLVGWTPEAFAAIWT